MTITSQITKKYQCHHRTIKHHIVVPRTFISVVVFGNRPYLLTCMYCAAFLHYSPLVLFDCQWIISYSMTVAQQ